MNWISNQCFLLVVLSAHRVGRLQQGGETVQGAGGLTERPGLLNPGLLNYCVARPIHVFRLFCASKWNSFAESDLL